MNSKISHTISRKPLLAMIALSAILAAPAAFAQSQQTQEDVEREAVQAQEKMDRAATEQSATGASAQSAESSTAAGEQRQQGWNDVDTDQDGTISKQESSVNAGLSQIFDQADGDQNGQLTQDEYKSFVSKNYGDAQSQQPQQTQPEQER